MAHQCMTIRNTFVTVVDLATEAEPGSRLRARSCGDEPEVDSAPITFVPSPCNRIAVSQHQQLQLAPPALRRAEQAEGTDAWWLDDAADIETVLTPLPANLGQLSATGLVSTLHAIAKLSEVDAFGNVQGMQGLLLDVRFKQLVTRLQEVRHEVETPRAIMRLMWALAKVGVKGGDVSCIISHVADVTPQKLLAFSPQELSNVLWGLARLNEGKRLTEPSTRLADAIVWESTQRLGCFTMQCLTNSFWAVAKMELRGQTVQAFVQRCIQNIHASMFQEISPQGLSNSLWACAKLQVNQEIAVRFCTDAARRVTASEDLVTFFFPQELSMALWAMARVLGRRAGRGESFPHVDQFASRVADEACVRIRDFTPQGISNIAWALATLDLVRAPQTIHFFRAVVDLAPNELQSYPPQAIANVCWALSRKDVPAELLTTFAPRATSEARARFTDFSWQDLSGIISSLIGAGFSGLSRVHEVQAFATTLVNEASSRCSQIGKQALLNIALSAARLKLDRKVMRPLVSGIEEAFAQNRENLNNIDERQWNEVKSYCNANTGSRTRNARPGGNARGNQKGSRGKQ
eukprot:TRINITY_DN4804_c0_g2_i1.p1 TRINITY_DN4804_c0_g2~~TRINITY_DN4804_c0_g2_i1.p1  ORF type:complete len:595 (+),score=103.46 TRINITY_DN4804_c0_g2_i1:56-1786(+)